LFLLDGEVGVIVPQKDSQRRHGKENAGNKKGSRSCLFR
jgi:hypothetical protein